MNKIRSMTAAALEGLAKSLQALASRVRPNREGGPAPAPPPK